MERLRVIPGGLAGLKSVVSDPFVFQQECADAYVASWRARGLSPVIIENDIGVLERTLTALGAAGTGGHH